MSALVVFYSLLLAGIVLFFIAIITAGKKKPIVDEYQEEKPAWTPERQEKLWDDMQLALDEVNAAYTAEEAAAALSTHPLDSWEETAEQKRDRLYAEHVEELGRPKAGTPEYQRWYYRQNREKMLARSNARHKAKRKEDKIANNKQTWYLKNKERILEKQRQRRADEKAAKLAAATPPPAPVTDPAPNYKKQEVKRAALALAAKLAPRNTQEEAYSMDFGAVDAPGSVKQR